MSITAISATVAPVVKSNPSPDVSAADSAVNDLNFTPATPPADTSDASTQDDNTTTTQNTPSASAPAPAPTVYNSLAAANNTTVRGTGVDVVT